MVILHCFSAAINTYIPYTKIETNTMGEMCQLTSHHKQTNLVTQLNTLAVVSNLFYLKPENNLFFIVFLKILRKVRQIEKKLKSDKNFYRLVKE